MADVTVIISSPGIVTWGSGNFGDGSYGGQALSLGLLQGTVTVDAEIGEGWGNNFWGEVPWGGEDDVSVNITGLRLNTSIGIVDGGVRIDIPVTGSQLNVAIGNSNSFTNVSFSVSSAGRLNTNIGTVTVDAEIGEGWGNNGWGIVPWGEEESIIVSVTGRQLNTSIASVNTSANANVNVTGSRINTIINSVGIAADGNISVVVGSEHQLNLSLGNSTQLGNSLVNVTGTQINTNVSSVIAGLLTEVPVTGSRINTQISSASTSANANVNVTGTQINGTVGNVIPVSTYTVTGSRLNLTPGQVSTVGSATVSVTGSRLNITAGNLFITAWAEVDIGVTNVWTEVDIAA